MKPVEDTLRGYALLALVAAACFGAGVLWTKHGAEHETQAATVESTKHQEAADAARTQAEALHAQAGSQAIAVKEAQAKVDALRARLAASRPSVVVPGPVGPVAPAELSPEASAPASSTSDLSTGITWGTPQEWAALSQAQDEQIAALKAENATLRLECEAWKRDADESRARAGALEVALRAKTEGLAAAKWINRAEGFAAGAAFGYLGGRCR